MSNKKEQTAADNLRKSIHEQYRKWGTEISSNKVDSMVRDIQEKTDKKKNK